MVSLLNVIYENLYCLFSMSSEGSILQVEFLLRLSGVTICPVFPAGMRSCTWTGRQNHDPKAEKGILVVMWSTSKECALWEIYFMKWDFCFQIIKAIESVYKMQICLQQIHFGWFMCVDGRDEVHLVLAITIFQMCQSFLELLAPNTACRLISWRFLVARIGVKAKTCCSTWILLTPGWSEWSLFGVHVSASGNGAGKSQHVLTAWLRVKLGNLGHDEVNSYNKSCSTVSRGDASSCQNILCFHEKTSALHRAD